MQGSLHVWKGIFSGWVLQLVRVHDEVMFIGIDEANIETKIHLKIAQIISSINDPLSFIIHSGSTPMHFKAQSLDQKVRWCKSLKMAQEEIAEKSNSNELLRAKLSLGKPGKSKVLQQLNTQLWKSHAELESRLEDCLAQIRTSSLSKSSIDNFRIVSDSFKFKTKQILQLIGGQIQTLTDGHFVQSWVHQPSSAHFEQNRNSESSNLNQTQYYHFDKKLKQHYQRQSISFGFLKKLKSETQLNNPFHQNILNQNKVYLILQEKIFDTTPRLILPETSISVYSLPFLEMLSSNWLSKLNQCPAFPLKFREPLSNLQQGCEQFYYSSLLRQADHESSSAKRMLYVCAFIFSSYSFCQNRIRDPFPALKGQTFQFVDEGRELEYLAEQLTGEPSTAAIYARSECFEFWSTQKKEITFSGLSLKIGSNGKSRIRLDKFEDTYVFNSLSSVLTNLLIGENLIERIGQLKVVCKKSGLQSVLVFEEKSLWGQERLHFVRGQIKDKDKVIYKLQGHWNKDLTAKSSSTSEVIWKKSHKEYPQYYNFTDFSLQLNALTEKMIRSLPATDSRFRFDIRALQHQQMELALEENSRLLNTTTQQSENVSTKVFGKWFQVDDQGFYVSNNRYWAEKLRISFQK